MTKIKKIALIGLGALGCAYASKLYEMNPEGIKIIAGEERVKRYKEEGVVINGKCYDFTYVAPEAQCEPADLIIVAVKTYQLSQAVIDIKNQIGENTIILSLLNGITSETILGAEYGMEKILYAVSFALTPNREGNHIRFSGYGNLAFGEKSNVHYSDKVMAVKELFDRVAIPYSIPEDMMRTLWWKFMVNVGINQCSAVTRGRYGMFQTVPEAIELMKSAMWEVIRLSEEEGINLNGSDIDKWIEVLNKLNPANRTSMLEDIECGRKTEVDAFAGTVCDLGDKHGIDTLVNKTLFNIIKLIERSK